ncbi:uncharacterized protein Dana_GF16356 [Drosophila ananassae]|uniref:C2HC/C3H-type domain-containing protein n=1 Tax=Drosophila ananassae TaxID=7217 RepID=B3LWD2_DROAN|nr:uncharacterized protein LOC6499152 [Drosophila ananassae]XP_032309820.1 uncharacterized protein LOC6499152 [Drosophila ananassae]EDV43765.1 uncharacterized protein Dana_GF16356 [Drosophila ananassae]
MASEGSRDLRTSRLAQMQMRFQQRTQQEQEVRRRELVATKTHVDELTAIGAPSAATSRLIGNGKVRQMFDERRRGAGIDRSNPLKPIGTLPSPPAQTQTKTRTMPPMNRLAKGISTMSLKEPGSNQRRSIANDNNNNKYATPRNVNANRNLKPVVTRKTPPVQEPIGRRSASSPQTSARAPKPLLSGGSSPPAEKRVSPPSIRRAEPKSPAKQVRMQSKPTAPEGTALCRFCGRHFNTDRLAKHEAVCQKTMSTKRRIFDASKQRIVGTEAEKFNRKPTKGMPRSQSSYSSAAQQKGLTTGVKKNNWRKKHEEFIQSIRAAKQVQAHLARGGKLSDLPPPPPSENPDYIQCPHCGRRFNQQAAERHIPKCETMIHNKPRMNGPPANKKR